MTGGVTTMVIVTLTQDHSRLMMLLNTVSSMADEMLFYPVTSVTDNVT